MPGSNRRDPCMQFSLSDRKKLIWGNHVDCFTQQRRNVFVIDVIRGFSTEKSNEIFRNLIGPFLILIRRETGKLSEGADEMRLIGILTFKSDVRKLLIFIRPQQFQRGLKFTDPRK